VILPLCSALVRTHPEHHIQPWGPQYKTDTDLSEWLKSMAPTWSEGWNTSAMKTH